MQKLHWLNFILVISVVYIISAVISPVYAQYPGWVTSRIWGDNGDCSYSAGEDPKFPYTIYVDGGANSTNSDGYVSKNVIGGNHTVSVTIPPNYVLRTGCAGVTNPKSVYVNGDTQSAWFPLITMTPTPAPFQTVTFVNQAGAPYGQPVCNAAWNCGTTLGTTADCAVRSSYTVPILQTNTCAGIRTPSYIYADLLGVTPVPTIGYQSSNDVNNSFYGWPVWNTGGNTATFVWGYNIYGWTYTEEDNAPASRGATEDLLGGFILNLSGNKTDSTTSLATAVPELNANYIFNKITDGNYLVSLAVTPTGYALFSGYTNPRNVNIAGQPKDVQFPFISITPSPGAGTPSATPPVSNFPTLSPTTTPSPTLVPSVTPSPTGGPSPTPTLAGGPTPTSTLTPTPTRDPSTLTPTPSGVPAGGCKALPTPVFPTQAPPHELCTKGRPDFYAYVENPNKDSVWAYFYSNAYDTFGKMGTVQPYTGGNSSWTPDTTVLNPSGGFGSYWWTAYTESPGCPRSNDAPSRLLNIDRRPPPTPTPPSCVLKSQNLVTGVCTFTCSWPADLEPTPASCSDVNNYHPIFWTAPGPGSWDPGWMGNTLSTTVTAEDAQELYSQLQTRDGLGNISGASVFGGPFTCPGIEFSASPTPGGPTVTPSVTSTPTLTPTPTITLTPTPGAWIQVQNGDLYMSSAPGDVPPGQSLLTGGGVMFFKSGSFANLSSPNWGVVDAGGLPNTYSFSYYWEALKNKAKSINNQTVAIVDNGVNLDQTNSIYSYSGLGYYQLSNAFNGSRTGSADVTVVLVTGSLEINQNFVVASSNDTVVFIVNGNIFISGNVTTLDGLYFSSQTFTIGSGTNPITINGMVYVNTLNLNPGRTYRNLTAPTYKFIYQPKYMIALLPYLGRASVNWQEIQQ